MSKLLSEWIKQVELSIDSEGIRMMPCLCRLGGKKIFAIVDLGGGVDGLSTILKKFLSDGAEEIIFGLDRFGMNRGGVETESFVSVYHYTAQSGYKIGVMQYTDELFDIDWGNEFWIEVGVKSDIPALTEDVDVIQVFITPDSTENEEEGFIH